ncbi:MAG: tRNA U34 5-methylaminomethyl-2-thiouridine-forming methyltransferase MnmC [Arenicella sp.]|jgi:tRNA U34 5-methylaminomethyl-2-thiouridine-forming methyltransferase MnmC
MDSKIIVTEDNSKTLLIPELNETYHSAKGALTEALHVFIKEGLEYTGLNELNIFEMGMGTGLNALLTLAHSVRHNIKINYTTIEKFPLPFDKVQELDYLNLLDLKEFEDEFKKMHSSESNTEQQLHPNFIFKRIKQDVNKLSLNKESIDLIYYDAFGPKVQSELWTEEVMLIMKNILVKNGILITYCAQGAFKRTLKSLNFDVQGIPGPPGKREITRAIKQ